MLHNKSNLTNIFIDRHGRGMVDCQLVSIEEFLLWIEDSVNLMTTGYKSKFKLQIAPADPSVYIGWPVHALLGSNIKDRIVNFTVATGVISYGYRKRLLKTI
jgi:hypothetical protein